MTKDEQIAALQAKVAAADDLVKALNTMAMFRTGHLSGGAIKARDAYNKLAAAPAQPQDSGDAETYCPHGRPLHQDCYICVHSAPDAQRGERKEKR